MTFKNQNTKECEDLLFLGLECITFWHFTDITFCHKWMITCRLITWSQNHWYLNVVCRLSALTTWLHLEQTLTLEYDLQIGRRRSLLLYTLLLSILYSAFASSHFSLLFVLSAPRLLFNSLTLCLPSVSPSLSLCPSRSSFRLWPLSLHPHSVSLLSYTILQWVLACSPSPTFPCLALGCCGEAPGEKPLSSSFPPTSTYQLQRRRAHCFSSI